MKPAPPDVSCQLPTQGEIAEFAPLSLRGLFIPAEGGVARIAERFAFQSEAGGYQIRTQPIASLREAFESLQAIERVGRTRTLFMLTRNPSFVCLPPFAGDGHWWSTSRGQIIFSRSEGRESGMRFLEQDFKGKWFFTAKEPFYPFEDVARFQDKQTRRRFTPRMLFELLHHFDLHPLDADFYPVSSATPAMLLEHVKPRTDENQTLPIADYLRAHDWLGALREDWEEPTVRRAPRKPKASAEGSSKSKKPAPKGAGEGKFVLSPAQAVSLSATLLHGDEGSRAGDGSWAGWYKKLPVAIPDEHVLRASPHHGLVGHLPAGNASARPLALRKRRSRSADGDIRW